MLLAGRAVDVEVGLASNPTTSARTPTLPEPGSAVTCCYVTGRDEEAVVHAVTWKAEPDEHDFPAATAYLSLLLADDDVGPVVESMRNAALIQQKAKDILRASRLPLLPPDNPHVAADLEKVEKGKSLSPVLLVRGDLLDDRRLQIADGYHRVCASYHVDENTDIPCRVGVAGTRTR